LNYVEGFTFGKAGADLKDSTIMSLSPSGIKKLKDLVKKKGLKMESIYVTGGKTVTAWKKDFELAKKFGVKYVAAEPTQNMWDSVDSLAGVYGIKVALHNHWKGNSIYWHPDSVLAALKNHPNFGACADLGHYPKSGINPLDAIKKLEGHIIEIHLKDIAEYNNTKLQDVPVGTGIIDFPAIFTELKRQKFTGNIMIERDTKEKPSNLNSVIQMVKYYNETLKKLEKVK
jgi:L-ribulose-5-phosphate 3-epimerase